MDRLARFSNSKNDTEFGAISGFQTFFAFNLVPYILGRAREHFAVHCSESASAAAV